MVNWFDAAIHIVKYICDIYWRHLALYRTTAAKVTNGASPKKKKKRKTICSHHKSQSNKLNPSIVHRDSKYTNTVHDHGYGVNHREFVPASTIYCITRHGIYYTLKVTRIAFIKRYSLMQPHANNPIVRFRKTKNRLNIGPTREI